METPFSKVLTTPLIASLGLVLVTASVKRRQSGDRVRRHISPEIAHDQCVDRISDLEGNMMVKRFGEHIISTAGSKVSHVAQ